MAGTWHLYTGESPRTVAATLRAMHVLQFLYMPFSTPIFFLKELEICNWVSTGMMKVILQCIPM